MMLSLYKDAVRGNRIREFNNSIIIREAQKDTAIAFRSPDIGEAFPADITGGHRLFEIGAFSVYKNGEELYCLYQGARRIYACISPTGNDTLDPKLSKQLEGYLTNAYRLDPYAISARSAFEAFEELVLDTADFCGCLTDILRDRDELFTVPQYASYLANVNCEHIAISLPIISLMYRRISALRGFNFKVTVKESLPCLIFSAKVLLQDEAASPTLSAIPEYSALTDISDEGGLIIGARLKNIEEDAESSEGVYRLSIAICPQTVDPRGILRAPVWKRQVKAIIDDIDLDLEGKY